MSTKTCHPAGSVAAFGLLCLGLVASACVSETDKLKACLASPPGGDASSYEHALLAKYPALSAGLPHIPLIERRSPICPFELDGVASRTLYLWDDSRTTRHYGGNKPRKLEFLLAEAQKEGATRLVTVGALGTNHGLATTILGRQIGLPTTLVLMAQPLSRTVKEKLLLQKSYGADQIYGETLLEAGVLLANELKRLEARGEQTYFIEPGGTNTTGNLGYVSAGIELAQLVASGAIPKPEKIYVAMGTGGTLSGLVLGLKLSGLDSRVVGVVVSDQNTEDLAILGQRLASSARGTMQLLREIDPTISEVTIGPEDFDLDRSQLGQGYAYETDAAERAVAAAAALGVRLDTTYTGKSLAALIAAGGDGPIFFLNSYNSIDIAARAPARATLGDLPAEIRVLFE